MITYIMFHINYFVHSLGSPRDTFGLFYVRYSMYRSSTKKETFRSL